MAYWEGSTLAFGVAAGEEKGRIRLVLARGREERIQQGRIVLEVDAAGEVPGKDLEGLRRAGERVSSVERRIRQSATEVDVPLLWQIVTEGQEAGESVDGGIETLAGLAFDDTHGDARAALVLALLQDGIHFVRKGASWLPRPTRAVEDLRREREQVARRAEESRALFDGLGSAATGEAFKPRETETERLYLGALEQVALQDDAAPEAARRLALEALEASGLRWDRPHEGAFKLLRCVGRFTDDDQNLQPLRFGLRTEFPEALVERAREVADRGFSTDGRRDLTDLTAVSVDSRSTREIDDLISAERTTEGGFRMGIHIADPAAFVEPGDALDDEAIARGLTYYMPDLRLPMLPAPISEEAASLVPEQERPALSFLVELDARGAMRGYEIVRSVVRSAARLDYEAADRLATGGEGVLGELLATAAEIAGLRRGVRAAKGAVTILAPEVELHVVEDGVELERIAADSTARSAVSEAMVLAGEVSARFCLEAGLPVIYRRQTIPGSLPELPAKGVSDPIVVRQVRRLLKRAEVGLQPGAHASLGLEAYAQTTSPIRRYQDLAIQRQIASRLRGEPPCYDEPAMQRIAATTERAESDARRAERAADDYWMLRYLDGLRGTELEALVVQVEPRPVIQLVEALREQPMASLAGVELGQRIRLTVERANPRAGLLSLRRVD